MDSFQDTCSKDPGDELPQPQERAPAENVQGGS